MADLSFNTCRQAAPACHGTNVLTDQSGQITIPRSVSGLYATHQKCSWRISGPEGTVIGITIPNLELDVFDRVDVYETDGLPPVTSFSGRTIMQPTFTSSANQLVITFESDWWDVARGFTIHYEVLPQVPQWHSLYARGMHLHTLLLFHATWFSVTFFGCFLPTCPFWKQQPNVWY